MKNFNDDNVKELSFGEENSTPTVQETPTPEVKPEPQETPTTGGGNSFYDRQQDKNSTSKWTKDWRGKTLGLSLAGAVLITGGVLLGMWAGGYWYSSEFNNLTDSTELQNALELTDQAIDRVYDQAIIERYDSLVAEGYISSVSHDNKIEDIEDAAVDTIDNEKEALKDSYGNTWEDEWDKQLKSKGFHTGDQGEEEYKSSMIADDLEAEVKSEFTSMSAMTEVVDDKDGYTYHSNATDSKGRYYVIENQTPSEKRGDAPVDGYDDETYTPELLINLFLQTYQPIVFSNSLLPFAPVEGANDTEANIEGDNVYVTNENVMTAKSFARQEASNTTETVQAATNYGGIQKKYDIDFSGQSLGEEANIAVNLWQAGGATEATGQSIANIVNAGFTAVDSTKTTYDSWTSTDINNMDSEDLQNFGDGVAEALVAEGLLTSDDGTLRTFAKTGIYGDTVSFISTNGLNNVGISFEGDAIVTEQLDYYNDARGAIDLSLLSTYNTWLENSFKYITLADFYYGISEDSIEIVKDLVRVSDDDAVIFGVETSEEASAKLAELAPLALFDSLALSVQSEITNNYDAGKAFVEEHWRDYDATTWDDAGKGPGAKILAFQSESNIHGEIASLISGYLSDEETETSNNEVIIERGDK